MTANVNVSKKLGNLLVDVGLTDHPILAEVKHIEANRAFLLQTHSEQVDLINELQAKLDLYGKSGCDLVVCNEPQRCGTVQELEAERDKQGELLNVVQTLLPTVCQDKDYMKNVTPKELAETLTEFYQPGRLPIVESALREAQKAMPCYSCLSKDWCEKTPGYICQFRPIKLALEGRSEYCTDSTVNGKEKTK